jgi:hypothetical protein
MVVQILSALGPRIIFPFDPWAKKNLPGVIVLYPSEFLKQIH